jgi:hypothetical protein
MADAGGIGLHTTAAAAAAAAAGRGSFERGF